MIKKIAMICTALALVGAPSVMAQDALPTEDDYYPIQTLPIPEGVVLEVGGITQLPDKKLAVSSRRGDIYTVEGAFGDDMEKVKYTLFAQGVHEPLGLAYVDGWLYATQRPEVTKMKDEDGDGRADLFMTVSDGWGINGDYHEYAFGSTPDKEGNIWVVLCLTGSGGYSSDYRGWCVRVTPDGKMIPTASGIRSPGGIGFNAEGEAFYTDNQGPWNGSSSLKHLKVGSFQGNPTGWKGFDLTDAIGAKPEMPKSGSRTVTERERVKELVPPAIILPHGKMGQSPTGVVHDFSGGKFGPFEGQVFVGEQTHSEIQRVILEEVNGVYQGAAFKFRGGFKCGNIAVLMTPEGAMFAGGSNRGWGARGGQPFNFERVTWTGKVPFEVHEMRARPDGFELTFTKPADVETLNDMASYRMEAYTYIYQSSYGSPVVDKVEPKITKAVASADGKSVRIYVDKLTKGHVHELHLDGVRDKENAHPLLHKIGYYTLNEIPGS